MPCLLLNKLPEIHAAAKKAGLNWEQLHSFPHDSAHQKMWINALEPFRMTRSLRGHSNELCSLHFKPSDFEGTTLKESAIPSVFAVSQLTGAARCCVPGCGSSEGFNLYPFVPENDADDPDRARKRFRLWVRTLQVMPCEVRPEVWICGRHFVNGYPADLRDFDSVDWIPTVNLEGIPVNRCRECVVVLEKLQVTVVTGEENGELNLERPFCRLCLVQNVPLQLMFLDSSAGQRLAGLIERFTAIKIDSQRDSNGAVCFKCLNKLAIMQQMEQVKELWNSKNDLLEQLRDNNNHPKEDPAVPQEETLPVVSIPIDTLFESIFDERPKEQDSTQFDYEDFKQDLEPPHPANISQDCVIIDPTPTEIVDLTDFDERERLINLALRKLRKQFKPRKRKRSKTTKLDEPAPLKQCRNTRIG